MVFEFRQYELQKSKKQDAASLPQNHIQTSNAAENLSDLWASQCTQETSDEITDEAPGLLDELPPMEKPWKKPLNGNTGAKPGVPSTFASLDDVTSSTYHIQADSNTEISSKTYDYAFIIDKDTNLDQNIDGSRPPQSLDSTFVLTTNAAGKLSFMRVEWVPAPIHNETAGFSIEEFIGVLRAEMASLENSPWHYGDKWEDELGSWPPCYAD